MTRFQPDYVDGSKKPTNNRPLSLALRQLQGILGGPVFWLITVSVVVLTSMAGPYFTLERLSFPERLVYWGTTILLSTCLMTFLSIYAYRLTENRTENWVLVSLGVGIAGLLPVIGSIYLAEGLATGFASGWFDLTQAPMLALYVAPSLIAVTLIVNLVMQHRPSGDDALAKVAITPSSSPTVTLLQSKLPHHLGHEIISVRAQDHYVEVTTPKGKAMILMRLRDAVKDLEPLGGMQAHRSWWVNMSHVVGLERNEHAAEIVLSTGEKVPLGRSFKTAFRAALDSRKAPNGNLHS